MIKTIMGVPVITDAQIKEIHKRVLRGKKVVDEVKKLGISRAFYYQKVKELKLQTKAEYLKNKPRKAGDKVRDMYDLAKDLDIDFKEVHTYVNLNTTVENNIKRMNYLKNHDPKKFDIAVLKTKKNYVKETGNKILNVN